MMEVNNGKILEYLKNNVTNNLKVIKHHIEDLVMVNSRVLGSEKPKGYIWALASEKSHLRIDY